MREVAIAFVGALLLKVALLVPFWPRLYFDAIAAVQFGARYLHGDDAVYITSKTFVGPVLWSLLYCQTGVLGLKLFNLGVFVALCGVLCRLGRRAYEDRIVAVALLVFGFYVGTNLNIVAGEQDDDVSVLLFSLGVLTYASGRGFLAGLLMGGAFLFKFSAGIYFAGFAVYLLLRRRWRHLAMAGAGMLVPFLCLAVSDGSASTANLFRSVGAHVGYSSWSAVAFKMFSTGMLPLVIISVWVCRRSARETNVLLGVVSSSYVVFVLATRDAYAAGYVMMQSMLLASFLVAEFLVDVSALVSRRRQDLVLGGVLALYVVGTTVITYHNLARDTQAVPPIACGPIRGR